VGCLVSGDAHSVGRVRVCGGRPITRKARRRGWGEDEVGGGEGLGSRRAGLQGGEGEKGPSHRDHYPL